MNIETKMESTTVETPNYYYYDESSGHVGQYDDEDIIGRDKLKVAIGHFFKFW